MKMKKTCCSIFYSVCRQNVFRRKDVEPSKRRRPGRKKIILKRGWNCFFVVASNEALNADAIKRSFCVSHLLQKMYSVGAGNLSSKCRAEWWHFVVLVAWLHRMCQFLSGILHALHNICTIFWYLLWGTIFRMRCTYKNVSVIMFQNWISLNEQSSKPSYASTYKKPLITFVNIN